MPKHSEQSGYLFRERPLWMQVLAGIVIGLVYAFTQTGCGTVAPKPVVAHEVAFSGNSQTAGIIDCDKNGCLVTPEFIGRYRALEKQYGVNVSGDNLIVVEGANYRVPYEVVNNFAVLQSSKRSSP